ncbi:hypothetical protein H1C71_037596 [Ictidomys tridecemlineatus]|nr:hypothetical protein H1C71_037596 [Ictidomys tridecemlineatus]
MTHSFPVSAVHTCPNQSARLSIHPSLFPFTYLPPPTDLTHPSITTFASPPICVPACLSVTIHPLCPVVIHPAPSSRLSCLCLAILPPIHTAAHPLTGQSLVYASFQSIELLWGDTMGRWLIGVTQNNDSSVLEAGESKVQVPQVQRQVPGPEMASSTHPHMVGGVWLSGVSMT